MPYAPTSYLPYDFANRRHIGPSPAEMDAMLKVVGASSLAALIDDTLPAKIRQKEPLNFGKPKSERELLHFMKQVSKKNNVLVFADWPRLSRHRHTACDPAQYL